MADITRRAGMNDLCIVQISSRVSLNVFFYGILFLLLLLKLYCPIIYCDYLRIFDPTLQALSEHGDNVEAGQRMHWGWRWAEGVF